VSRRAGIAGGRGGRGANSKHEALNPRQIRNSNVQMTKTVTSEVAEGEEAGVSEGWVGLGWSICGSGKMGSKRDKAAE